MTRWPKLRGFLGTISLPTDPTFPQDLADVM